MNKQKHNKKHNTQFNEVWELYTHSFPTDEQRTLNMHLKAIENNRFCPYVYTSEQSELLAICFYWEFTDFIYLEHFAVNPTFRNKGIGSEILNALTSQNKPIILEIEPPIDLQQKQRLKFYQRSNFTQTGYTFKQLKYQLNSNEVLLELLCNQPMNNNLFEKFQNTIYTELEVYCETH